MYVYQVCTGIKVYTGVHGMNINVLMMENPSPNSQGDDSSGN